MADETVEAGNVVHLNAEGLAKALSAGGVYDPNEGRKDTDALFPSSGVGGDAGLAAYVALAERVLGNDAPQGTFLERCINDFQRAVSDDWKRTEAAYEAAAKAGKAVGLAKAIDVPANFLTFSRMTYMPDSTSSNILPWPGLNPEAIRKIVQENLAPNLIVGMRVDDVVQYSQKSDHLWKPGWRVELFQGDKTPSANDRKDMREAEKFLANSSTKWNYDQALKREDENLQDFHHFLATISRDSLYYDMIAIATDRDKSGKVVEYAPLPAGNIRLVGLLGYEGDKEIYAVAVDEGGAVTKKFTRSELLLYVRNPRTDPVYSITMTRSYGTPEIQTALKLIGIFQNVIDFNFDTFQRSGVPHGMLLLTGNGWNQKQVDLLTRMWNNLKRGISKALAMPVLAAPKDGKAEIVDFSKIKGDEAFYQDLLNLSIGAFCAVYRFPAHRIGYRISGHGPDSRRTNAETPGRLIDDDDPGKTALLIHLENLINYNFIWPRWPNLKFVFTGKEPKADAREYEARKNAQTWGEARTEADLPELKKLISGNSELAPLAEIMDIAPIDPNLSGVFQVIASAFVKALYGLEGGGDDSDSGSATMSSTKDPARAEHHGKVSGVRRNSAKESGGSSAPRST